MVKVLVLNGDGINCNKETAMAFKVLGAKVDQVSLYSWVTQQIQLSHYQILVLPGGFSFGDELGSGQVLGIKMRELVGDQIQEFYDKGGLILGICNGFQVLAKMGLLPMANGVRYLALDQNREGDFIDRWETLILNRKSPCIWTKNLPYDSLDLPVRHGEGRLTWKEDFVLPHEQEVFYYARDINGSHKRIAGITDPKGQILGLMPHPEGYFYKGFHPECSDFKEVFELGPGSLIFKNALDYCYKKEEEYA